MVVVEVAVAIELSLEIFSFGWMLVMIRRHPSGPCKFRRWGTIGGGSGCC